MLLKLSLMRCLVCFTVLISISTTVLYAGVIMLPSGKHTSGLERQQFIASRLKWFPYYFNRVRLCLENWHYDNPPGILAAEPQLNETTCSIFTGGDISSVNYDTSTGTICIRTSATATLEINDKTLICEPIINQENNQVSFLNCECKHNISFSGNAPRPQNDQVNLFIESIGIENCAYDDSITDCSSAASQ